MLEKIKIFFQNNKKKILLISWITIFLVILLWILFVFLKPIAIEKYEKYVAEKKQKEIEYYTDLVNKAYYEDIENFNQIDACNKFVKKINLEKIKEKKYLPIESIETALNYCDWILKNEITFSTWTFFNPRNDFKSIIWINFSQDFYTDVWEEDSEEFLANRSKAKKELLKMIEINPKVELKEENLVFSPNKAVLYLNFKELTNYQILIKDQKLSNWVNLIWKSFNFKTPESKYLKIFVKNPVSLYEDTKPPKFEIVEYKSKLEKVEVKICRIDNEAYAKIEQLREQPKHPETKTFFTDKIDELKTLDCFKKEISLTDKLENWSVIKDFSVDDLIWKPARSWLYYMTFQDKNLRNFNDTLQYPLFFWVVDSHLTMKISKNGEWFFFVNDFSWKPLANQKIRAYKTDFQLFKWVRNDKKMSYDKEYSSVIKEKILSNPVELWTTDKNWILKVNLNSKFEDAFSMTFEDWWIENNDGRYPSLFVTSTSDSYLTYNSSRWNAWIAPFNFWYKVEDYWWGEQEKESISQEKYVSVSRWEIFPEYLSHTYTDRVLYLPWEEVNIKSIFRKTPNLEIEKNKSFTIKINDPKWKEVLSKTLKTNDFWSFSTKYLIPENASLWSYYVYIMEGDFYISNASFSVEIFQNPKFKNTINLETVWLNKDFFTVKWKKEVDKWQTDYSWTFSIKWNIISTYFNWTPLANAKVTYKVYKQVYYDYSKWDECYYWCFYEEPKELYTEWQAQTDKSWKADFEVKINHTTSYNDYKYIVEATITDNAWDTISWANSIIVKLPNEYKSWNKSSTIALETSKRFYKQGEEIKLDAKVDWADSWDEWFNWKYLLISKKKDYSVEYIDDVKWYQRPLSKPNEKILNISLINSPEIKYSPKETWEYVFEYFKVPENFDKKILTSKDYSKFSEENIEWKSFVSVIVYGDENAKNPIIDDNKVQILSDKVSYHLWEKAKFLIRLPFSKWKILWTIEKSWVIENEYIDVTSNVFFKEVLVDDKFVPNAYVSVVAFDTDETKVPEYKVWYAEIVVDKTDKKSFIELKTDKTDYKPRDKVTLDINVKDKDGKAVPSEVSVMVVDDSLISLMWNVDLNLIDKFFKKLPFQIQTSLTNVVMLENFYFSRPWIVWWSWFWNFKWWDSAVSTRNIFKNTAYYNPSVITDKSWKAQVKFELPDNITSFRIIAVSNSKNNMFWSQESFINVKKNIIIESKTPIITRDGDKIKVWANIFNNTKKNIWLKVEFKSDDLKVVNWTKNVNITAWKSYFVEYEIQNANTKKDKLSYTISALWDSAENSDKFEWAITLKEDPLLISYYNKETTLNKSKISDKISIPLPENTDVEKSKIEINISNNRVSGIEKIVSSLAVYPYWCVEQTTSTTMPNVILKNFNNLFSWVSDEKEIDKNIKDWIDRIFSMQQGDWWFAYWQWNTNSDLTITPYVLRSLLDMKDLWVKDLDYNINMAKSYLEYNIENGEDNIIKAQIASALARAWSTLVNTDNIKKELKNKDLETNARIYYTYALLYTDKEKFKKEIESSIDILKNVINKEDNSHRYRDTTWNKAVFASLLIEDGYDMKYIETLIDDLYSKNWIDYYYSTQTKNSAFMAFYKYLEVVWSNNFWQVNYSLSWKKNLVSVWEENSSFYKKEFVAKDFLVWNNFEIPLDFVNGKNIYVDVVLKHYPLDVKKIKPYSNKINIKKEIFAVNDDGTETKVTNNIFKRWQVYKVNLKVEKEKKEESRNLVIEDYQASSFKVINSKFNTNATSNVNQNNRYFDYTEIRPEVLFLNSSYNYWDLEHSYLFVPEYIWTFSLPPASVYMMYEPEVKAYTSYETVQVVE